MRSRTPGGRGQAGPRLHANPIVPPQRIGAGGLDVTEAGPVNGRELVDGWREMEWKQSYTSRNQRICRRG
ncbi:hypothetical protein AAFF_G00078640 [Aldrovandia affinis]|uniref:Uncharacterized protein n=1 Tax=Aldrovandia affinis TaxID=143900 RepID=A0AAD7RXM5_9TELE|nr:hypothetical protein AAFF_G00078640 [Aldrovandia affinis]